MHEASAIKLRRFRKTGIAALIVVYLVILAGGVVRMTGSGMGCPDWPKCFGQWVPPTHVDQLPQDYRTRYDIHGHGIAEFNPAQTWTEYINRLIGALSGLFVLAFALRGLPLWKDPNYRSQLLWAIFSLVLLVVQAWLGSVVVKYNLAVGTITLHMLVAILIVFAMLMALMPGRRELEHETNDLGKFNNLDFGLSVGVILLVVAQIVLGSQVREAIDEVSNHLSDPDRETWVQRSGTRFLVHRAASWLVAAAMLAWYVRIRKATVAKGNVHLLAKISLVLLLGEIASGVSLAYFGMPAIAQPLHLVFASVLAGVLFYATGLVARLRALGPARNAPPRPGVARGSSPTS